MKKLTVRHLNPDHIVVRLDGEEYFTSYGIPIAYRSSLGEIALSEKNWDYSNTTGKYRNQFLNEKKKETQAKIDSCEYTLF